MQTDVTFWVLSDGRAGNEAQALGLAEALARRRPASVVVKRVRLSRWAELLPAGLSWRLARAEIADWPFSGLAEGAEALAPPWPAAVIGAGRRVAPVAAALRRRHDIAAVQILDPHMPARAFDAVVVPQHDVPSGTPSGALTGANVIRSVGAPNRLTASIVAQGAACWAERLGRLRRPRLAVLIGGPSRSASFTDTEAAELTVALKTLARGHGLMVTGSRRTPEGLMDRLRAALPDAFVWDGAGENPYLGVLGHADAVLVTEDSVNMASEAGTTGLPVHVFPVGGVAPKIARFHESLAARGVSRRFTGAIARWTYEPLAEADRVAGDLMRRGVV
jgi:mitochondrial fission protein ELM1